jgi:hypothetical protein
MNASTGSVYHSKIEFLVLIPLILLLGSAMFFMIVNKAWIGAIVNGAVSLIMINIYSGTYYRITPDGHLIVKCGVLERYDIDIAEIEWIKKSRDLSNAPALSLDRLEVNYKGGRVLVSPKDKKNLLLDLKKLNPKIWTAEV